MILRTGGHLTFFMPKKMNSMEIHLSFPKPLSEVLREINIPLAEVAIIAINGDQATLDQVVEQLDEVLIHSIVDGG